MTQIDLTGQSFGDLEVLGLHRADRAGAFWVLECSCGNAKVMSGSYLRRGTAKHCGCKPTAEILTGQKYGRLLVLGLHDHSAGKTRWVCECECGNFSSQLAAALKNKSVVSCGCFARERASKRAKEKAFQIEGGTRFTRLTVIKRVPNEGKSGRKSQFLCVCDCGVEKVISGPNLVREKSKSCGCLDKEQRSEGKRRHKDGKGPLHRKYSESKYGALRRGYEFNLTKEEAFKLYEGDCYYCGQLPFNGIDRLDPDDHYYPSNCVGCCIDCNRAKLCRQEDQFISWVHRAHYNLRKKGL